MTPIGRHIILTLQVYGPLTYDELWQQTGWDPRTLRRTIAELGDQVEVEPEGRRRRIALAPRVDSQSGLTVHPTDAAAPTSPEGGLTVRTHSPPSTRVVGAELDVLASSTPPEHTPPTVSGARKVPARRPSSTTVDVMPDSQSTQNMRADVLVIPSTDVRLMERSEEGGCGGEGIARRLADHLADWIERNGSKRPTVTDRWVKDIDLMIRVDGRDPDHIRRCIDWCQRDSFWRTNILSTSKLRKQYDRLRLAAERDRLQRAPKIQTAVERFLATETTP